MAKYFKYDVFLSHSIKDKAVILNLAEKLRDDGVKVWFSDWEIRPENSIPIKTNDALNNSRILILALSVNNSESDSVMFERQALLFNDPTNSLRGFIPLRLDNSEIQPSFRQFVYVDWRRSEETEYRKILSSIFDNAGNAAEFPQNNQPENTKIEAVGILSGHVKGVNSVNFSGDGKLILSSSIDKTIRVWETDSGKSIKVIQGHSDSVGSAIFSVDNQLIISGSDDKTVRIWETANEKCLKVLKQHSTAVWGVAISSDNKFIVSGSSDRTIRIWETETGKCLQILKGHTGSVQTVDISTDNKFIVTGSNDDTIRIFDIHKKRCIMTIEGHADSVQKVIFSDDNKLIVSGSNDKTVRLWETQTGKCLGIFEGHANWVSGVAISPDSRLIASGSFDNTVRLWDISSLLKKAVSKKANEDYRFYTNAKVLLVGDSGVGKSGLAYRLTQDRFVETFSTDGVWATQMSLPNVIQADDTEREIWLWDFAGQSDYRLIHQLFMDEAALAILVFNPQTENPFEGLGQWDSDLQKAARRPFKKLLVAGRCDRGSLTISRKSLDDFKAEKRFDEYFETSALTGEGCSDLREAVIRNINWDDIPYSTSPRIFKLLKEEVFKLKDEGKVLLRLAELKQNIEMRLPNEKFDFDELRTVVGLLAGSGVVWELQFGDFILLHPERINSYAAAMVRSVRAHVDEIGCIAEEKVLAGEFDYQDMERLPKHEEEIVLRAMYQTFVGRGLCLREATEEGGILVFPSYFRRERPELEQHPSPLVTYQFRGMIDEIYATLIVKLHYTSSFERDQLWRYAADFKTQGGKRVGLKLTKKPEGAAEITIYFEKDIPDNTKVVFIRYVHDHLKAEDENVLRIRHYICPHCGEPFENNRAIQIRLGKNLKDITCWSCENKFNIWDLIEEKFESNEFQQIVRQMEEESRIDIDNESRELILIGHAYAIAGEAGQIFRQVSNSDWGISGEIEFKDEEGKASGKRVYLQLKSGDSYLRVRKRDEKEVFTVKSRQVEYWLAQNYDVMLVVRRSNGEIRWMNATEYLRDTGTDTRQIVFDGEPFSALNILRLRDKLINSDSIGSRNIRKAIDEMEAGQIFLNEGNLDKAITKFQRAISLNSSQEEARQGLFKIAHISFESTPDLANLAINTLLGSAQDWLAEQICEGVELSEATIDSGLKVILKVETIPITLVAANNNNGFGWEIELTSVDAVGIESEPLKLPIEAERKDNKFVQLTADSTDIPWGLYSLKVRFQVGGREFWTLAHSISNEEPRIPYIAGPPIRDPKLFFGRQKIIDDVKLWLEDYSVVLLGPRRVGKTSLLYQLERYYKNNNWTTVLLDLHAFVDVSEDEMSTVFRQELYNSCVQNKSEDPKNIRELETKLYQAGIENLLILLDEVSVLKHYPKVALQLRAMSKWQKLKTRIIVAGTASDFKRVVEAVPDRGSPPFNEFKRGELEEITHQDAQELLEKPVLGNYFYDKEAIEKIIKLCGGHPFYLNTFALLTLKALRADKGKRIKLEHVEIARKEAVFELAERFQEMKRELDLVTESELSKIIETKSLDMSPSVSEALRNVGLTIGLKHNPKLFPLFVDWWNLRL